jgi:hypothetical protein
LIQTELAHQEHRRSPEEMAAQRKRLKSAAKNTRKK